MRLLRNRMDNSEDEGGLATASLPKRMNVWKRYIVLTVNALDDDAEVWEIKARNANEAYEKADAGSHNLDTNLIFTGIAFLNLADAVEEMRARIEAIEDTSGNPEMRKCGFCKARQANRTTLSLRDMEGHTLFLCSDCNEELMSAYAIG